MLLPIQPNIYSICALSQYPPMSIYCTHIPIPNSTNIIKFNAKRKKQTMHTIKSLRQRSLNRYPAHSSGNEAAGASRTKKNRYLPAGTEIERYAVKIDRIIQTRAAVISACVCIYIPIRARARLTIASDLHCDCLSQL